MIYLDMFIKHAMFSKLKHVGGRTIGGSSDEEVRASNPPLI